MARKAGRGTPVASGNGYKAQRIARSRVTAVRIAVVGLGYWGPNLVRNLVELPEAEIAYVCDLRQQALDAVSRRYAHIPTTTRFSDILEDATVDAVAIATPVSSHYALAKAALEAGKHVFVEKPLCASSHEAEALIELAAERNRTLMPGHTFLYSPPVNMIGHLIESGELGEIYFISTSRVNLGLHQPDVSVVWDLAPHDFSILLSWLRETPSHVAAVSRGCIIPDIPDVAFMSLKFPSGTLAHVELSWLSPSKLRRTAIIGSRKMVVYDDTAMEPVRVFDSGVNLADPKTFDEYQLSYRTGDIVSPAVDAVEPLLVEMGDFCSAIRHGTTPRSTAELGLQVVKMMETVDASVGADGAWMEVPGSSRTPA